MSETHPAPEHETRETGVLTSGRILCWKGPKMGITILTASQGELLLTTTRLLFRSPREKDSRQIPLSSLTSCVAGKKRALVVSFRDDAGAERSLTFGQQMGMPDLHRWVTAISETSGLGR